MNRSRKDSHTAASIVDAAALQSEMTKRFGLAVAPLPGRKRRTTTATTTAKATCQHCPSCGFSMEDGDSMEYCHRCGYGGMSRDGSMGASGAGPSLAERRGLSLPLASASSSSTFRVKVEVMKPMDWYLMECHLAKKRDPDTRCPICMEVFNRGEEVLLSCGHIFHQVCLRSFENFMRTTELSCPICRTKNYQKKLTKLGHQALERMSAERIQALARGWLARKKFKIALRRFYRSGHGNEQLRTKYFHTECAEMTEKMDRTLQHRVTQVDNMMRLVFSNPAIGNMHLISLTMIMSQLDPWIALYWKVDNSMNFSSRCSDNVSNLLQTPHQLTHHQRPRLLRSI